MKILYVGEETLLLRCLLESFLYVSTHYLPTYGRTFVSHGSNFTF